MLEQFMKLPPAQKAGVLAAILAVVGAGGYFMLIDPEFAKADKAKKDLRRVEGELQGLQASARDEELVKLRKIKDELVERDKENRKLLPTSDELPNFIENVHKDALKAGLRVRRFERLKTKERSMVHAIPVKMVVKGSMIDFIKFLRVYAGPKRRVIHLRDMNLEIIQPDYGVLGQELRQSRPVEEQKRAFTTPEENILERILVTELARKRTHVLATFVAYAFIWTGKEPENPEPPEVEGKKKRT